MTLGLIEKKTKDDVNKSWDNEEDDCSAKIVSAFIKKWHHRLRVPGKRDVAPVARVIIMM